MRKRPALAVLIPLAIVVVGLVWWSWVQFDQPRLRDAGDRGEAPGALFDVLGYAALSGVASMALLQIGKNLFLLRSRYQTRQVANWLRDRVVDVLSSNSSDDAHVARVLRELEARWAHLEFAQAKESSWLIPRVIRALDVLGWRDARRAESARLYAEFGLSPADGRELFDLPLEQLCAQVGALADRAVRRPDGHAYLLVGLAGTQSLMDVSHLSPRLAVRERLQEAADNLRQRIVELRLELVAIRTDSEPRSERDSTAEDVGREMEEIEAELDAIVDGLSRADQAVDALLANIVDAIQKGIDSMQVSVGQRWRRYVRMYAMVLSGLVAMLIAVQIEVPGETKSAFVVTALCTGGFFAWFTRDLVAVVERLRQR